MSIHEWSKWCKDNPDWQEIGQTHQLVPQPGEVGEWRDKLINKNPGWNDVLAKASKAPGAKVKKL